MTNEDQQFKLDFQIKRNFGIKMDKIFEMTSN